MGGEPLMELEEAWIFGMWPKRLLIFEDRIEARDFELFREKVEPSAYSRIRGVAVSGKGWHANLVVTMQGSDPILIRGLSEDSAERARALIEERIARASEHRSPAPTTPSKVPLIQDLTELRDAGILSEEEFETKCKEVLRADTDLERSRDES